MIELIDNWVVLVDDYNYTLARITGTRIDKKTGRESPAYKVQGYYRSLESAVKALGEQLIRDCLKDRRTSLAEAVHTITESNKRMETLLHEVLNYDGKN